MSKLNWVLRAERIVNAHMFWVIHAACLAAIFTGISWTAAVMGCVLYLLRMFAITGGYHRYFAHRSYQTSRTFQFILAVLGTTAIQRGPIFWAATHRVHHKLSDQPGDPHSPRQQGFWRAHIGWFRSGDHDVTDEKQVPDLLRFSELRWLDTYHWIAPLLLAIGCGLIGGTSGLIVGFAWSTVAVWHATFCINSLAHVYGSRRYSTNDDSRNNWWLAILTMGEGWHNNHHHMMGSTRQGFFWWEIDLSYYILRALALGHVVWNLKQPPKHVIAER